LIAVKFINTNILEENGLILAKRRQAVDSQSVMSSTISEPGVERRI
jgi:hypothetical protein